LAALGLHRPYLLTVGTIQPRKNLPVLFEAFAQLREDVMLAVVGANGWDAQRQLEPIDRLRLHRRIVRPGYISEADLPGLYASAAAIVYSSRYEGFGLPVVEGLAAGVPVVVSDIAVFREVGGGEVTLFDPTDPDALARAIEAVLSGADNGDAAKARRRSQARRFDWSQSATIVARRLLETS
jgi:glycosyltransferase involved in cell wall biosynthesis